MSHRILLASLNAGGGHRALRDSFLTVLEQQDPRHQVLVPVSWDSSDRFIEWFYSVCVHYLPRFQGVVYALSDSRVGMNLGIRFSPQLFAEARVALEQQRPAAVISTHPVLSMMFQKAKRELGLKLPIISAIPDYGVPSASFNPRDEAIRPDALIVMSEETQRYFAQDEDDQPLHYAGFITRPEFEQMGGLLRAAGDRRVVRRQLLLELEKEHPAVRALDPAKPTVLFMGGSAWTEKTRPVLEALLALPEFASQLNVIVVCGRDHKFQDQLSAMAYPRKNFAVFGFVTAQTLSRLMAVADLPVLGSLAPATMQELLELGCGPLLLNHYIPGTEQPHVGYIHDHRIGRYEPDASRMVDLIMQATGFTPPSQPMRDLLRSFPMEARRIRAGSRSRAEQLPQFLSELLGLELPVFAGRGAQATDVLAAPSA